MQNIFRDEQIINGIRYYIKDDGLDTLVVADTWDRLFKPISTGKPDLHTKGDNPNRKYLYLKGKKSYR